MNLLEELAQRRTNDVVYSAISLTIERIAAEAARDILKDVAFREELRALARKSVSRAFRDLHEAPQAPRRSRKGGAR